MTIKESPEWEAERGAGIHVRPVYTNQSKRMWDGFRADEDDVGGVRKLLNMEERVEPNSHYYLSDTPRVCHLLPLYPPAPQLSARPFRRSERTPLRNCGFLPLFERQSGPAARP